MADHGSGPRALADPVADISDFYAFPSPERPGNLVLVMNVFPFAAPTALFSDAVDYHFRLRPAEVSSRSGRPAFAVGDSEGIVGVRFGAPPDSPEGHLLGQAGVCTLGSGKAIGLRVGDERGAEQNDVRVFAGGRLDSFFIDQGISGGIRLNRRLPTYVPGRNSLQEQDVLTIVVEGPAAHLFGLDAGPLVAIIAETTTIGSPNFRIERMGRPEIKNFIMLDKSADPVNRNLEIRDLYNSEDAFHLLPDYVPAYRSRLNSNLAFYDALDAKTDWPLTPNGDHPLTELLLADFLVVDLSKPFQPDSYFEIERALLRGAPHQTCGGRWLNDDIVDQLLTLLVNNGNGPIVTDGVTQATVPATRTFPYAQPPNPSPPQLPSIALPE
jgi:hypothetical protein